MGFIECVIKFSLVEGLISSSDVLLFRVNSFRMGPKKVSRRRTRKHSSRKDDPKRMRQITNYRPILQQSCIEKKYFDTNVVSAIWRVGTFVPAVTPINVAPGGPGSDVGFPVSIIQGAGVNQRVGNKICVKNINLQGVIQRSVGYQNQFVVRCLLVLDKQCSGTDPTVSTILSATSPAGPALNEPFSQFRSMSNVERYTILKEKRVLVPLDNDDTMAAEQIPFKMSWKGTIDVNFSGAGSGSGTVALVRSNNIFALFIASYGIDAVTYGSTFVGSTRIKYTDL